MSCNIIIRRAEENEAESVREIVRAAYSKWISVIAREPTPMTADFNKSVRDHDIDLAIHGSEIVGLIETWPHADYLWIEKHSDTKSTVVNRSKVEQPSL